jgi:hypothetical protein
MRRRYVTSAIAIGSATAAYIRLARPWQLRWGATDPETDGPLPGDDLIANPDLTATRAITVGTSCKGLRCLIHIVVPGLHAHPGWFRGWR